MMYPYYYNGWGMNFGSGGIIMMILIVIFWVVIVWAIVSLVRRAGMRGGYYGRFHEPEGNSALKILDERYAKGEINKEEYEQKKKDLQQK